jgi:hypothetical protein
MLTAQDCARGCVTTPASAGRHGTARVSAGRRGTALAAHMTMLAAGPNNATCGTAMLIARGAKGRARGLPGRGGARSSGQWMRKIEEVALRSGRGWRQSSCDARGGAQRRQSSAAVAITMETDRMRMESESDRNFYHILIRI